MTDKATDVSPEEPNPDGVFSSRLRSALGKRSGTWLARQFDAAPSTVNDWLRGSSEPTLSRLVLAAQVLGVSVQWLAVGEEDGTPPSFKPVMVEVALDRLEAAVRAEAVPIGQDALADRPDLEGARRQLIEISNDPSPRRSSTRSGATFGGWRRTVLKRRLNADLNRFEFPSMCADLMADRGKAVRMRKPRRLWAAWVGRVFKTLFFRPLSRPVPFYPA